MVDLSLISALKDVVGPDNVLSSRVDLSVYGYDASLIRRDPDVVVLPGSTDEVKRVVELANARKMPYVARGSGTNLSGGSIPLQGGIVLHLSRMSRILDIDLRNRSALVEPGVYNQTLQDALAPMGYYFAPDPASQKVSTLGGNIGENAGGPHCLKYGVTTNHVLAVEWVDPEGRAAWIGGRCPDAPGCDLLSLLIGSEGTLGIVTKMILKIMPMPEKVITFLALYDTIKSAGAAVSAIIGQGIVPATLEMMDRLVIRAVEESVHAGYPMDVEAVLIIELDGPSEGLERQAAQIEKICRDHDVREIRRARSSAERERLWEGRRGAFGAVARLSQSYLVCDGTVPRTRLPEVLQEIQKVGERYQFPIGNVFHAGDGNLHPLILFNESNPAVLQRVHEAGREILQICVQAGGTISGEHGIGAEKLESMLMLYTSAELATFQKVKKALDPHNLCNPGKVFPVVETEVLQPLPHDKKNKMGIRRCLEKVDDLRFSDDAEKRDSCAVAGVRPASVVFPTHSEQVSSILRLAQALGVSVIPRGSGTAIHEGFPLQKGELALVLSGMDRILEWDMENLVVSVEAGMPLAILQERLARSGKGYFFPLDPPGCGKPSLGGLYSANSWGTMRLGYGTMRDLVLGVEVVLPGGDRVRLGGRTVKNVSGYDLTRLMVGALGTLGVVTSLTLKVFPLPEAQSVVLALFDGKPEESYRAVSRVMDSRVRPVYLEWMDCQSALDAFSGIQSQKYPVLSDVSGILSGAKPHDCLLAVGLHGLSEAVEAHAVEAENILLKTGAKWAEIFRDQPGELVHKAAQEVGFILASKEPDSLVLLISVPIGKWAGTMEKLRQECSDLGLRCLLRAHAGCGTIRSHVDGEQEAMEKLVNGLIRIPPAEGHIRLARTPYRLKNRIPPWGNPVYEGWRWMGLLREALDPRGILNPGRLKAEDKT